MRRYMHITCQRRYRIITCVSVVYQIQSRHYFNKGNIMDPTSEELYVACLWDILNGGHYAGCAAGNLEEAARIIKEDIGEEASIVSLHKEIKDLLITGKTPELMKETL